MPLLTYSLTVPPLTPENIPVRADFIIGIRTILRAGVLFPNGCFNSTAIRLELDGVTFAPLPSGWIRGNDIFFQWYENRKSNDAGLFSIVGYSIAEDYDHTPVVYLEII